MKIQKNLMWLKEFIEEVDDLVPVHKIKAIKGYKIQREKQERTLARCSNTNNKYTITLLTEEQSFKLMKNGDRKFEKYVKLFLINILENLSHELSHLTHWQHDANHFILQSKISLRFAKLLKKKGITETYGRIP